MHGTASSSARIRQKNRFISSAPFSFDHDAVAVAGQDPGGVLYGLAAADLAVLVGEVDAVAAQLIDAGLKGSAHGYFLLSKQRRQSALWRRDAVDMGFLLSSHFLFFSSTKRCLK